LGTRKIKRIGSDGKCKEAERTKTAQNRKKPEHAGKAAQRQKVAQRTEKAHQEEKNCRKAQRKPAATTGGTITPERAAN
jgi:hypothetical protein